MKLSGLIITLSAVALALGCGDFDETGELELGSNSEELRWETERYGDGAIYEAGYGFNQQHSAYEGGRLFRTGDSLILHLADYCQPNYEARRDCMWPSTRDLHFRIAIPTNYALPFRAGMNNGYQEAVADLSAYGFRPTVELVHVDNLQDLTPHLEWAQNNDGGFLVYQHTNVLNDAWMELNTRPGPNDDNSVIGHCFIGGCPQWHHYFWRGRGSIRVDDTDVFHACSDKSESAIANRIAYFTKRGMMHAAGLSLTGEPSNLLKLWDDVTEHCGTLNSSSGRNLTGRERNMLDGYCRFGDCP